MKRHRNLALWLAALLPALTLLAITPPASAAPTAVTVTCTEASITLYGNIGDQIELTIAPTCSGWEMRNGLSIYSGLPQGWLEQISVTPPSAPQYNNVTTPTNNWYIGSNGTPFVLRVGIMAKNVSGTDITVGGQMAVLTKNPVDIFFVYGGVPAPSPSATSGSPIAPILQGLPLPPSGNCATTDDRPFAWGTNLSGGWQRSWQSWAGTNGEGGWACIRVLANRDGIWTVDNSLL